MTERFSASVAGRHMACHASAQLELAIPNWTPPVVDPDTGAKAAGNQIHELLAEAMAYGTTDLNRIVEALDYVAKLRKRRRFKVLIEQTVSAAWLLARPNTTVDLVLHTADELHVLDWKTGKIPVEVYGNEQLLYYLACFAPLAPKAKEYTVHIVQPWADNIQAWVVSKVELESFIDQAQQAELAIAAGSTMFGPSDHCKFCPANPHSRADKGKPLCPAMLSLLYPPVVDEDELLADI